MIRAGRLRIFAERLDEENLPWPLFAAGLGSGVLIALGVLLLVDARQPADLLLGAGGVLVTSGLATLIRLVTPPFRIVITTREDSDAPTPNRRTR